MSTWVVVRSRERVETDDGAPCVPQGLTPRELAVLHRVVLGHSNKQIARALTVTSDTVKYHLKNIYTKLGARGRLQAVALADARGLLAAPSRFEPATGPGAGVPARRARSIGQKGFAVLLFQRDCPAERPGPSGGARGLHRTRRPERPIEQVNSLVEERRRS